jgi:hypothetical protein
LAKLDVLRPGGSCSYLPYFIGNPGGPGDPVELPITLPMDHTLFQILQHDDATVWLDKAARVRDRGGMVLILTHPDYADDPRVPPATAGCSTPTGTIRRSGASCRAT